MPEETAEILDGGRDRRKKGQPMETIQDDAKMNYAQMYAHDELCCGGKNVVVRVGARIYGISNAGNSTGLTLGAAIQKAQDFYDQIIRSSKVQARIKMMTLELDEPELELVTKNISEDVATALEVAGALWATQANNNSSKVQEDCLSTALTYL